MIYYLKGKLCELEQDKAVVECGGVGYLAMIGSATYQKFCDMGAFNPDGSLAELQVTLYTFVKIVDESRFEVFGFDSKQQLAMFNLLQTVSGIGPRAAMAILSALSVNDICNAIASDNTKLISTAQGVGQKAAQKICIDLKGKLDKFVSENPFAQDESWGMGTAKDDEAHLEENQKLAVEALTNLGYTKPQASKAVKKAGTGTVEDIIRRALSALL